MSAPKAVGKKELLLWATQFGGVPCTKYDDLKDGLVLVALLDKLIPNTLGAAVVKSQLRGTRHAASNWETLRAAMEKHGLPTHLCDRQAVAAGRQRHCFNMLVLFFFLAKLAHSSDFSVDFEQPIDDRIAEFLQSPASLVCLGKLRSADASSPLLPPPSLPPRASRTSSAGGTRRDASAPTASATAPDTGTRGDLGNGMWNRSGPVPERSAESRGRDRPRCGQENFSGLREPSADSHYDGTPRRSTETPSSGVTGSNGHPPPSQLCTDQLELGGNHAKESEAGLRHTVAQLDAELRHVKAIAQLHQGQQRVMVESELTRLSQRYQGQLEAMKMEKDYEVKRFLRELRSSYDEVLAPLNTDASQSSAAPTVGSGRARASCLGESETSPLVRILRGKIAALESDVAFSDKTIDDLRRSMAAQVAQTEALCEKIHTACTSLVGSELLAKLLSEPSLPVAAAPVSPPLARDNAEAGSDRGAVVGTSHENDCARDHSYLPPVRDALILRIARLENEVSALKWENARLRDAELPCGVLAAAPVGGLDAPARPRAESVDVHGVPLGSDGLIAPSVFVDGKPCTELCRSIVEDLERQGEQPLRAEAAVRQLCAVVELLQGRIAMASQALVGMRDVVQEAHRAVLESERQHAAREAAATRDHQRELSERTFAWKEDEAAHHVTLRLRDEELKRLNDAVGATSDQVRALATLLGRSGGAGGGGHADRAPGLEPQVAHQVDAVAERIRSLWADVSIARNVAEEQMKVLVATRKDLYAAQLDLRQVTLERDDLQRRLDRCETSTVRAESEMSALRRAISVERDSFQQRLREMEKRIVALSISPGPRPGGSISPPSASSDAVRPLLENSPATQAVSGVSTSSSEQLAPSLFSPEELERRKLAILSKYRTV